ncbi:MAG: phosphonate C-P lyase system protein PhnG [Pseudomonadota bacterium]|nr:phosphonate C-P lyase system protein PhnG [Pseudomonadota bacterium]
MEPDDDAGGLSRQQRARKDRLDVLAHADPGRLRQLWSALGADPRFRAIRGPETGLVALRGRMGGTGAPFNFGEATVTRATVRLDDGPAAGAVGHAVLLGRDHARARLVAVIDALATDELMARRVDEAIVAPLRDERAAADMRRRAETAATRVDFFTVARGED